MKILHIITSLELGGAEKLLSEIIPLMKNEYNLEVDLLILNDKGDVLKDVLMNQNVNIFTLNSDLKILKFFELIKYINMYDVIHSHLFPSNYLTIFAKFFTKNKFFITTEHNTHNRRRNYKYFKIIERFIYCKYNKIISISNQTEDNLKNWLDFKDKDFNKKFTIIENGVNLEKFFYSDKLDKSLFFKGSIFLMVMVGSFTKQKDQATIIKSLPFLPRKVKLLLVGEGPNKSNLEELSKKLNVDDRVLFTGIRNDINRILKTVDLSIVSSNWEGFGLVAVEAMASKLPVIVSDVDGLKQIVEGNGIIFERGNETDLSSKILKLMDDNLFYNRIAEQCYEESKKYSINKMTLKYIEVYKNLER